MHYDSTTPKDARIIALIVALMMFLGVLQTACISAMAPEVTKTITEVKAIDVPANVLLDDNPDFVIPALQGMVISVCFDDGTAEDMRLTNYSFVGTDNSFTIDHTEYVPYDDFYVIIIYLNITQFKYEDNDISLSFYYTGAADTTAVVTTLAPLTEAVEDETDTPPAINEEPTDAPTTAAPTTAQPTTAEPTTEEPTTVEPTTEAPTTEAPTTEEPTTAEPTTEEPTTVQPTTAKPTVAPTTAQPTTAEPTEAVTTKPVVITPPKTTANAGLKSAKDAVMAMLQATTAAPTTAKPTEAPTTAKSTVAPTTAKPTEANPPKSAAAAGLKAAKAALESQQVTTAAPTTVKPTAAPTTAKPTVAPTTAKPTAAPTTAQPTTAVPTAQPTTEQPTTAEPTTAEPTTEEPTEAPTTVAPTTVVPTTIAPTTAKPTEAPTTVEPTTEVAETVQTTKEIPPPRVAANVALISARDAYVSIEYNSGTTSDKENNTNSEKTEDIQSNTTKPEINSGVVPNAALKAAKDALAAAPIATTAQEGETTISAEETTVKYTVPHTTAVPTTEQPTTKKPENTENDIKKVELTKLPSRVFTSAVDVTTEWGLANPDTYNSIALNMDGAEMTVTFNDNSTKVLKFKNPHELTESDFPYDAIYNFGKLGNAYVYDTGKFAAKVAYPSGKSFTFTAKHINESSDGSSNIGTEIAPTSPSANGSSDGSHSSDGSYNHDYGENYPYDDADDGEVIIIRVPHESASTDDSATDDSASYDEIYVYVKRTPIIPTDGSSAATLSTLVATVMMMSALSVFYIFNKEHYGERYRHYRKRYRYYKRQRYKARHGR